MSKKLRQERPNREKDNPTGRGFVEFPKNNRFKCRVINIENPGEDYVGFVNGVRFQVRSGEVVELHKSQIENIRHTTIETSEWIETPNGWTKRPIFKPRATVEILDHTPITLTPQRNDKGQFVPVPPGTALSEGPEVVSGRM